jgi:hypothetical protein
MVRTRTELIDPRSRSEERGVSEVTASEVWGQIVDIAIDGRQIPLKTGLMRSFCVAGSNSVGINEVTAPDVSRAQIERALQKYPLSDWPSRRVQDVEDTGNTAYVWALLNAVATGGRAPTPNILGEIRGLAARAAEARSALDAKVRQAASGDLSLRQIGEAAGMSHQTVARIVAETPVKQ